VAFLAAQTVFRKIRFVALGGLIFAFGAPAKRFIDKYFNLVFILVMLAVILIVLCAKYLAGLVGD
jgi:hypothetical protein